MRLCGAGTQDYSRMTAGPMRQQVTCGGPGIPRASGRGLRSMSLDSSSPKVLYHGFLEEPHPLPAAPTCLDDSGAPWDDSFQACSGFRRLPAPVAQGPLPSSLQPLLPCAHLSLPVTPALLCPSRENPTMTWSPPDIQESLPISRSLTYPHLHSPFYHLGDVFTGSGD